MSDGAVGAVLHPQATTFSGAGVAFQIADWAAWSDGQAVRAADEAEPPNVLPPLLRRRVSAIGQSAFRAAQGLAENMQVRFVFCSRHGEFARTHSLLESLCAAEPASPGDFSLSVHNALAGLLSMARKNRAGHTAIAAGRDSFACGLLEAATCLAAGVDEAVLLVYFDEPLPEEYQEFGDPDEASLALALLLHPARGDGTDLRLSFLAQNATEPVRSATAQAMDFLRFLSSGAHETVSPGERMQWRWSRGAV